MVSELNSGSSGAGLWARHLTPTVPLSTQGGVEIFLVASWYRNRDKLQADGPLRLEIMSKYFTIHTFWTESIKSPTNDIMVATLMLINNQMASMFVSQTNPVAVKLFSYLNDCCPHQ